MDRDKFAKATRLGRQTGRALETALDRGGWGDDYLPRRFFEVLLSREIPSLAPVLDCAREIEHADLLPIPPLDAVDALDRVAREARGGMLDAVLREEAKRAAVSAEVSPATITSRFGERLFKRFVIDGRGGLRERRGDAYVRERATGIRDLLAPILRDVTASLVERPSGVRRRLTANGVLTADSDLIGSAAP